MSLVYGTVCETHPERSLVKVDIRGRVSDWMPIGGIASGDARLFAVPTVGQQVLVGQFGDGSDGVVICSVFGGGITEPTCEDGTNTSISGGLTIHGPAKISGEVEISEDLTVGGTITDSKGDLTNFETTDGAKRA